VVGDTLSNDEAYVSEESQTHDDEPYYVDEKQIVDGEPYVIDGLWGKYLSTIPSLYVAPNDIQRLVNNILDNARKHGFTDHKRGDYEVDVKLSINTETQMFQIDFRNNGNPLPEGMDKTRYGIKGEKAGATGGTGIGGSYVKKCVEHYGGDYNIFTEDGWTVVRICLPIK
jgi:signal transduction histidine kinase